MDEVIDQLYLSPTSYKAWKTLYGGRQMAIHMNLPPEELLKVDLKKHQLLVEFKQHSQYVQSDPILKAIIRKFYLNTGYVKNLTFKR